MKRKVLYDEWYIINVCIIACPYPSVKYCYYVIDVTVLLKPTLFSFPSDCNQHMPTSLFKQTKNSTKPFCSLKTFIAQIRVTANYQFSWQTECEMVQKHKYACDCHQRIHATVQNLCTTQKLLTLNFILHV